VREGEIEKGRFGREGEVESESERETERYSFKAKGE
jgi:hypothetical protein